jgi:hypothetical protein
VQDAGQTGTTNKHSRFSNLGAEERKSKTDNRVSWVEMKQVEACISPTIAALFLKPRAELLEPRRCGA